MEWRDPATWLWCAAWAVACLGAVGGAIALRGRAKPATWCRGCDYDLAGLSIETTKACPECGREPGLSRKPRRKRRPWLAGLSVLLLLPLFTKRLWLDPASDFIWRKVLPQQVTLERFTDGGLEWELFARRGSRDEPRDEWGAFSQGARVWLPIDGWTTLTDDYYRFDFATRTDDAAEAKELLPRDVTGDGVPEVLTMSWSGGAHCCMTLYVIDTRADHDAIISIQGDHGSPYLKDVDSDGIFEIVVLDWTFAYWGTSFASSPAPEVILSIRDGRPVPRADLMRKPPPSTEDTAAALRSFRSHREKDSFAIFWRPMLDWIYEGNEISAWNFFDAVWDDALQSRFGPKDAFRDSFIKTLNTSRWWPAIRDQYAAMEANEKAR